MKKKISITYPKQRAVLSDVLPYESPLTFSNRYFYRYLIKKEKCDGNQIYREKNCKAYKEINNILFKGDGKNSPFCFIINHKKTDFRTLNIIHPFNQLRVMEFYERYKSLILYYCNISPFSIRKPASIAKFSFFNDLLHLKNKDGSIEHSQIEQEEQEYENLKSYFSYQKYSNIHRFFESYQFHRSEKKYNKLLKIDISKCFDSIYSHTVSWAIYNKSIIKDNIDYSRNTFAGEFDDLMQKLNANETNGIVIGPEFSRIFAEIILQQIDLNIFLRLKDEKHNSSVIVHKIDYEIFRYVDDYFIFYNEEIHAELILSALKLSIKEYKLHVNDEKSITYEKPIITEISIAKQKISDLFNLHLNLKIIAKDHEDKENDEVPLKKYSVYFSSNNLITRFKSIVKETGVEYKDIMNYSLAVIDRKTQGFINKYKTFITDNKEQYNEHIEKQFEKGFLEILDVAFFLYSVSPRVNSTIKLCLIIDKIVGFLKKNKSNQYTEPFYINNKHNIFKKVSDEIYLILQKNKIKKNTPVETLYLLIALSQLGREYRLHINNLISYFNIENDKNNLLKCTHDLNYFSITVLLFYIRDSKQYQPLKELVKNHIIERFTKSKALKSWTSDAEIVMLLMDVLTCPFLNNEVSSHLKNKVKDGRARNSRSLNNYIKQLKDAKYKYKRDLLTLMNHKTNQIALIEQEKFWFTKWTDFDFRMELEAKRSQEVY